MDDFIREAMDELSMTDTFDLLSHQNNQQQPQLHSYNNFKECNDEPHFHSQQQQYENGREFISTSQRESPIKQLALKEQEHLMDALKKENFSLKLRVHFLEETLGSLGSSSASNDGNGLDALKENVDLKCTVEQQRHDLQVKSEEIAELKESIRRKSLLTSSSQSHSRRQSHVNSNYADVSASVVEETVVSYRKQIENLEQQLTQSKAHVFELTSMVSQRAVEVEQLRGQCESAQLQLQALGGGHQPETIADPLGMSSVSFGRRSHNGSFSGSLGGFDPVAPVANPQMEKGINLLRSQISDLKMQIIEKSARNDKLLLEIDSRGKNHQRMVSDLKDAWHREEQKLKNQIHEVQDQLNRSKSENQQLTKQMESVQRTHYSQESHLHIQLQEFEHQLQIKSEKLALAQQQMEKMSADIKTFESTLTLKKTHIDQLSRQLENKNSFVHSAEKEHRRTSEQMQIRVVQLQKELSDATIALQTRDAAITLHKEQIERQKHNLAAIEDRWARQSKDVSTQQRDVRQELEVQIHQFQAKSQHLSQSLQAKEHQIAELQEQIEMQYIGHEESMRSHLQEKERMRLELQTSHDEVNQLKQELARTQHRLSEIELAYKESVATSDRLQIAMESMEDRFVRHNSDLSEKEKQLRQKEEEIRERNQMINQMNQRIMTNENALAEGQEIVKVVEVRFHLQLEERNQLLTKVGQIVDKFLQGNQLMTKSGPLESTVAENFFLFSETLLDKCQQINRYPILVEQKTKNVEARMNEEMKTLNKRLERKIEQIEKFEDIVREAVAVQKKMRDTLKAKHQELQEAKMENNRLDTQLSLLNHELTALRSEYTLNNSNEKTAMFETQASIAELERQVREKDRKIKDDQIRISELERSLIEQKQASDSRMGDLNSHLRLLRQELERSQQQTREFEKLLSDQDMKNTPTLSHHPSTNSLLQASEAALEKLTHQYGEEINSLRAQLDRENTKYKTLDNEYAKVKNELQSVRKRLAKRESMIEMALGKLEVVSHRKDTLEANVLNQFTEDVKRMMERSTSDYSDTMRRQSSSASTQPVAGAIASQSRQNSQTNAPASSSDLNLFQ